MDVVGYGMSFAFWWGAAITGIVILRAVGVVRVSKSWLVAAIAVHAIYVAAVVLGGALVPLEPMFGELQMNWGGKVAAIIASLVMAAAILIGTRTVSLADMGITLRRRPGSLLPAILATALMAGALVGLNVLVADGRELGAEHLLYQSTMPGLDEELFFRGLLLAVLARAVTSGHRSILGAPISWAGVVVTVLFGLGHSLFWNAGSIVFDAPSFIVTGTLGLGLLWIRERTGSVIPALLAHNFINVAAAFF